MKRSSKVLASICLAIGVVICSNNISLAAFQPQQKPAATVNVQKVAIVDVQKVVAKSAQVQALKKEQEKKAEELAQWLETVNTDIKKQSTAANQQKLTKKYNDQLTKKREANAKAYATKLAQIDKSISATIAAQAKAQGYTLVLSKSNVLYGGDDITAQIMKVVK